MTRAQLIESTGFSRSTVGHAVGQLIDAGLLEESDPVDKGPGSGRGRPGLTLRPVASTSHVAAIDFGHQHVTVAIADGQGAEVARTGFAADLDATTLFDRAASSLQELREAHGITRVDGVVAGIPRPLDRTTRQVLTTRSGKGWDGLFPAAEIADRIGVETHVENDAVLGAIGERSSGAARGLSDFLYIKVAHGVGAALFLNGVPYYGARGIVGDIGHCRIPGRSELCRCGHRGCVEAVASIDAVRSQIAITHPGVEPQSVLDAGDETVERILNDAGRALGRFVAHFCNLLNPAGVVIGGSLGSSHPPFIEGVSWAVDEFARPMIATGTVVTAAELGASAEIVGGMVLAAELATARHGR